MNKLSNKKTSTTRFSTRGCADDNVTANVAVGLCLGTFSAPAVCAGWYWKKKKLSCFVCSWLFVPFYLGIWRGIEYLFCFFLFFLSVLYQSLKFWHYDNLIWVMESARYLQGVNTSWFKRWKWWIWLDLPAHIWTLSGWFWIWGSQYNKVLSTDSV